MIKFAYFWELQLSIGIIKRFDAYRQKKFFLKNQMFKEFDAQ